MVFPTLNLALGVCEEWKCQNKLIDVDKMPLTKLLSFSTRVGQDETLR